MAQQNLQQIIEIMDTTDSSDDEVDSNVGSYIIDFEMDDFDDDMNNDPVERLDSEVESDASSTSVIGNSDIDSDESDDEVISRTSSESDYCARRYSDRATIPSEPVKKKRSSIEDIGK
jgi:hypothetical protein